MQSGLENEELQLRSVPQATIRDGKVCEMGMNDGYLQQQKEGTTVSHRRTNQAQHALP